MRDAREKRRDVICPGDVTYRGIRYMRTDVICSSLPLPPPLPLPPSLPLPPPPPISLVSERGAGGAYRGRACTCYARGT